jgi:hypothetical protein
MKTRLLTAIAIVAIALASSCDGCNKPPAGGSGRDLQSLTDAELDQKLRDDLALIKRYDEGLQRALDYAATKPELFPKENGVIDLNDAQKAELREIWRTVLDYMWALDATKAYWKGFHKFNVATRRPAHVRAYLAGYGAFLVQYRHGLRFVEMTVPSQPMEVILDEGAPDLGIHPRSFAALKYNVIHVKAVSKLLGGREYYRQVVARIIEDELANDPVVGPFFKRVETYDKEAREQLKERALVEFSYNAYDIARDTTFDSWFPVQSKVAEWMGDTKVRRLKNHLIHPEQIEAMHAVMEPGDVILARHNWYLSNVGLPGFWPHAELYLGSQQELKAYFDDPAVKAHFGGEFSAHLASKFPDQWATYGTDEHGEPRRIAEALSEGVLFTTLSHGVGCDYVGIVRPKHDKVAKAQAIERAFTHIGKPYDFNFDFLTDESIVCTELVYKAWQPDDEKPGVELKLSRVMGRTTLPANDIVQQFDETYGTEGQLFDFVYFLDGVEKGSTSIPRDVESFRSSWKRPKWDVLQK